MNLSVAIDFSGNEVALAIINSVNGNLVCNENKIFNGRDSSGIASWILAILKQEDCSLDNINEWTVGTGPGNFSGLRIMSALVSGFLLNKDNVKKRNLPSIFAIAKSFLNNDESVKVLYNARRNEIAIYEVKQKNDILSWNKQPIFINTVQEIDEKSKYIAMEFDKIAITQICGEKFANQVSYLKHFPAQFLLDINKSDWNNNILDLQYLRPPVN